MIIDSHIHFPGGCEKQPGIGRRIVELARKSGIGICVVSHIFGEKMGANLHFPESEGVALANRFAAREASANPGRLFFMGYINPQCPDWQEEMEQCAAEGACGIKLWVSLKDARGSLANTVNVLRRASLMRLPVYLHVFNRTGGNLPGEICMEEFVELAQEVPDCRMIAGHTGGNWRRSAEVLKRCPDNAWMETGGSNPDYGMVDGILRFCPPEKLLYGSDGPGRAFFPQIWKILESSLSPSERERVLWKNAMELLHLPEPPEGDWPTIPPSPKEPENDYCCFCGHYPFETRPENTPEQLERLLEEEGIAAAFTADFGAIFSPHPMTGNRSYLEKCRCLSRVKPLAVVNPNDREWEASLKEISASTEWSGLWLSPAFHQWQLDAPEHIEFLRQCASLGKTLFINCGCYEPRFFQPETPFREVAEKELRHFLEMAPSGNIVIQGAIPPRGIKGTALWCYTQLTDRGSALPADIPLVRGSEYPFRHLHETFAASNSL